MGLKISSPLIAQTVIELWRVVYVVYYINMISEDNYVY